LKIQLQPLLVAKNQENLNNQAGHAGDMSQNNILSVLSWAPAIVREHY
jgi:hypothetical protein